MEPSDWVGRLTCSRSRSAPGRSSSRVMTRQPRTRERAGGMRSGFRGQSVHDPAHPAQPSAPSLGREDERHAGRRQRRQRPRRGVTMRFSCSAHLGRLCSRPPAGMAPYMNWHVVSHNMSRSQQAASSQLARPTRMCRWCGSRVPVSVPVLIPVSASPGRLDALESAAQVARRCKGQRGG
jgi:hypothetical protein